MKSCSQPRYSSGALLAGFAVLLFSCLMVVSCGDVYRPVANPVPAPGGDPQALHLAMVVNNNNGGIGSTNQIDVSGDSSIANFTLGRSPVHGTFIGGALKVVVVNKADETLSSYFPSAAGSIPTTTTLPSGAAPVFIAGTSTVFVAGANPGACGDPLVVGGCVYVVNSSNVLTNSLPVGHNPVALAQTPNAVYAINQGDGTVTPISTSSLAVSAPITVGLSPMWATTNPEGSTLYVATQGSNTVSVIDVASNTVLTTLSVGTGPRFLAFDSRLRRLYVANTGGNTISVFSADVNPPTLLGTVSVGTNPLSITPLADGTRVYVANAGCVDRLDLTMACTGNTVSVIDASSLTVRKTITVGTGPVSIDSSPDSIRVVVANRDSNSISSIRTSDDSVINTLSSASPTPVFVTISH